LNSTKPQRAVELLRQAAATIEQRGAERDQPQGERSMCRAVEAFNALTGHAITEPQGWLFMAVLKMARATAGNYQPDDWVDGAAYMALGAESEERIDAELDEIGRQFAERWMHRPSCLDAGRSIRDDDACGCTLKKQ
jgi:hypothetical protein